MDARIGVETPARAAAVRATGLLESGPESSFDRLTALAATLLGTSMTYLTLADETHSVLKGAPDSAAMCGPDGQFRVPVREAACQIVVDSGVEAVVPDTAADPRLRDLAQVKQFGAAAWIGVPVSAGVTMRADGPDPYTKYRFIPPISSTQRCSAASSQTTWSQP